MSKMDILVEQYSHFLAQSASKNAQLALFQFKNIIQRFTHNTKLPLQNDKFLISHLQFLFQVVSSFSQPFAPHFTTALQVLNHLLRSSPLQEFTIPINLLQALAFHLSINQAYRNSSKVITNVIWLICRCLHHCRNRELFVRSASETGVLQLCLQSKALDHLGQKGLILLLNYMFKRQLERKEIYLSILRNIEKFNEAQMWNQILVLLRKDRALEFIQSAQQYQQQLNRVLVLYLNRFQTAQTFLAQNQKLIILAAKSEVADLEALKIQNLLELYLTYSTIELQQKYLNKIFDLCSKLFQNEEKLSKYLNLALNSLYSNQISRRIFVQHHQKINYKQFLDILKSDYPKKLSSKYQTLEQGNNRLKFLICMKRIAKRLQIEVIYDYKLKPLVEKHLKQEGNLRLNDDLVEMLRHVTKRSKRSEIE